MTAIDFHSFITYIENSVEVLHKIQVHTHVPSYLDSYARMYLQFLHMRACLATMQRRAFSVVGPSAWNDLPLSCIPR